MTTASMACFYPGIIFCFRGKSLLFFSLFAKECARYMFTLPELRKIRV